MLPSSGGPSKDFEGPLDESSRGPLDESSRGLDDMESGPSSEVMDLSTNRKGRSEERKQEVEENSNSSSTTMTAGLEQSSSTPMADRWVANITAQQYVGS